MPLALLNFELGHDTAANWSCYEAPPSKSSCSGSSTAHIATVGRLETRMDCAGSATEIGRPQMQSKVSAAILNCIL